MNHPISAERMQVGRKKHAVYLNFVPMGFDIETYTQYKKSIDKKGFERVDEHYTNMYMWQFALGDHVIIGRTWDEFDKLICELEEELCYQHYKTLFFIHNLSFEFSFCAKELQARGHTIEVFARSKRHPMKVVIDDKIIILDSAKITGFSLKKLAENYTTTQKLDGEIFDYKEPRNRYTPLTDYQIAYGRNDVLILSEYAQYYADTYLSIHEMPMTSTMVANLSMKNKVKELEASQDVFYMMRKLYPKTKQEYDYLMLFFSGAYTHGMCVNLFQTLYDGLAFDMQSQYPYCTMAKYFPASRFKVLTNLDLAQAFIDKYCCLIDITIKNYKSKTGVTILSKHKAVDVVDCTWDNGRLYKGKSARFFITELDYKVLKMHADFDEEINALNYATRGYLPNYFRLTVAELYATKARLKGKEDKLAEYAVSKASLNGESYGACCTRLNFSEVQFGEDGWYASPKDVDFEKIWMGKNKLPQWAIYITSHARYMILSAVAEICKVNPEDYWYSDTDSCKTANKKYILDIFEALNKKIIEENTNTFVKDLDLKALYPDIDFTTMGIFDREDDLIRFKCLGSKKYLAETEKHGIQSTIAGLPKGTYTKWCDKNYKSDYFGAFNMETVDIADIESDKLCTYYSDEPTTFSVTDKYGNMEEITTQSYVSLIDTSFKIKKNEDLLLLNRQLRLGMFRRDGD